MYFLANTVTWNSIEVKSQTNNPLPYNSASSLCTEQIQPQHTPQFWVSIVMDPAIIGTEL